MSSDRVGDDGLLPGCADPQPLPTAITADATATMALVNSHRGGIVTDDTGLTVTSGQFGSDDDACHTELDEA
ncbi:hypothetical protein MLPF_1026 [Mycobacterium lepromatosis]|nr:hypothetical protein MLPF_1026 [Mycobacterium lepromatosis]